MQNKKEKKMLLLYNLSRRSRLVEVPEEEAGLGLAEIEVQVGEVLRAVGVVARVRVGHVVVRSTGNSMKYW